MKHSIIIILALLLFSCAQTSPLSGGPKDQFAPEIDSAKTHPYNGQTNFADDQVRMKFNEYIKLNKPNDNILIFPLMEEKPTIEAKNKRLTITFNEPLQEKTTYIITFNNAIQDITESNDSVFQYVFSTGNYIDSLQVFGSVRDAFTNQLQSEVLVALYPKDLEANFDSIPLKFKPTYLAQTNESGRFELNYLKDGVYYLFAFKDNNRNLLYDMGEPFSFIEEKDFNLTPDKEAQFELKTFREFSDEVFIEDVKFEYPGRLEVILSNPTDSFDISSNIPLLKEETGASDSLVYWLENNPEAKMRFYVELLGEKDTLKPFYGNRPDKEEDVKLTHKHNIVKGELLPEENLTLMFSEPVLGIDTSMVRFYDVDSNEVQVKDIFIDLREVTFNTFGTTAERIVIDSAAVKSFYNHETDAKIELTFSNHEADYYGTLIVTLDTTFEVPVVVHLIDKSGETVDTLAFEKNMTFTELLPGDYQLRLIFDVDGNGDWTSGSLSEGRIPEKVIYSSESINVKSKWEKEFEWILKSE